MCPQQTDENNCVHHYTAQVDYSAMYGNDCPFQCQPLCFNSTILCTTYDENGCPQYECSELCEPSQYDMYGCDVTGYPTYDDFTQYLCYRYDNYVSRTSKQSVFKI